MKILPALLTTLAPFSLFAQNDTLKIKLYDLQTDQPKAEVGKTLHYRFKIKNEGPDTFPEPLVNDCNIKAHFSADTLLDESDIIISAFSYELLAPNEVSTYEGDIYLPGYVAPGKYYVLVNSDYGGCYTENPEDHISICSGFKAIPFTGFPCTEKIAIGTLECTSYLENGSFNFITKEGDAYKSYTIDTTGHVFPNADPVFPETFYMTIEQNTVVKKNNAGNVIYTKTIPSPLVNTYNTLASVIEFDNGYIIGAFKNATFYPSPFAPNTAQLELTLLKTDADFNVISVKTWSTINEAAPNLFNFDDQRFAMGYSTRSTTNANGYILTMDQSMNILSTINALTLESYNPISGVSSPGFYRTICGDISYSVYYQSSHEPYYYSYSYTTNYFDSTGSVFLKSYSNGHHKLLYDYTDNYHFGRRLLNGDVLNADAEEKGNISYVNLKPTVLRLEKKHDQAIIYEKDLGFFELYPFKELVQLGQRYYLLNQETDKITLTPVDCDNNQPILVDIPQLTDRQPYITAYPNPTRGQLFLNGLKGACRLSLFSTMGNLVREQELQADDSGTTTFQIGNIPAGTYILHIAQSSGRNAVKVVVF